MNGFIHVFASRRAWALFLLGFASGLPLALSSDFLSAWLTDAGFNLQKIGLIGLAGLPYALKVLWAPLVDRFMPPMLGRRRGWMLISQILLIGAILVMAQGDPKRSLIFVAAAAMAVAFLSATQDTVVSAWQADVLQPHERGPGAAICISGYRLGMIASSAGTLILVGSWHISWPAACQLTAVGMLVGLVGVYLATEPAILAPPNSLRDAVVHPLSDLLAKPNGYLVLLFALIFKFPEYVAGSMSLTFLLRIGFDKTSVGDIRQGLGLAVTIVGALLGGGVVRRYGVWRSLWLFGILHSVSNLAFLALAESGPRKSVMIGVILIENLCIGLTTTGFIAWMISQCDARYSAFQYAMLSGIMALGRVLAYPIGGWMAGRLGWPQFFFVSALFGIPGLALLAFLRPERRAKSTDEILDQVAPAAMLAGEP